MSGKQPGRSYKAIAGYWVPDVEMARKEKLAKMKTAFAEALDGAHCTSSAGFEINADERAIRNVAALVMSMEASGEKTVRFCAYDNCFHEVDLPCLKVMQMEIARYVQAVYTRKWALREAIASAKTLEELDAVPIDFTGEKK